MCVCACRSADATQWARALVVRRATQRENEWERESQTSGCVLWVYVYICSGLAWLPHLYAKHTTKHLLLALTCALKKPVNNICIWIYIVYACLSLPVCACSDCDAFEPAVLKETNCNNNSKHNDTPSFAIVIFGCMLCFRSAASVCFACMCVCIVACVFASQSVSQARQLSKSCCLPQYRNFLWHVWSHGFRCLRRRCRRVAV